jgi:cytochrome c biogenesis protein CcdA/thiol-disulfide isomerase/thioredoxin
MILFLVSFIAGLLTVLAPCVLPLLPVIVGGSIGGGKSLRRAITVTASLTVSVIAFTLLIKASTIFIGIPQDFWKWFSGSIIILFGLISLFPTIWERLPFLSKVSIGSNKLLSSGYQKQNVLGDVIVGASLGPVFSTCSPTYFLVLAAVLPENFTLGMLYLISYSFGLSLALLAIAFVGQRVLERVGVVADPHGWFKKTLGVLFLVVGIAIITGADKSLQVKILDSGFFDVTQIEQKLLEFVPSDENNEKPMSETTKEENIKTLSVSEKQKELTLAPEISSPDGFVNTDGKPVTLKELRGKVVLLDIWTYSCINCQRTLPHLNDWYAKYKDQGLEIVGLHTPEFAFEHVLKNVENATRQFGIEYPVVLDNDYSTWNAYGNRYWPRKYLIDIDGYIIYDHIGEGGYEETEKAIQKALMERAERMNIDASVSGKVSPLSNIQNADTKQVGSPEIYFGSARNERLANGSPGVSGVQTLLVPRSTFLNNLYLGGTWNITNEFAESNEQSSIVFRYKAKNVYFVAGSASGVEIDIYKDGIFLKKILIDSEKLYTIIEGNDYGEHTLRMDVRGAGLKAFTFTFG